jgi:hypothetical protein
LLALGLIKLGEVAGPKGFDRAEAERPFRLGISRQSGRLFDTIVGVVIIMLILVIIDTDGDCTIDLEFHLITTRIGPPFAEDGIEEFDLGGSMGERHPTGPVHRVGVNIEMTKRFGMHH